jgi:hypothetical protein
MVMMGSSNQGSSNARGESEWKRGWGRKTVHICFGKVRQGSGASIVLLAGRVRIVERRGLHPLRRLDAFCMVKV